MPRRKGPPYFKAVVTVQNHEKMKGVYDDDALLAMWLRAGWLCLERFANHTGDAILVSRRDLGRVAATSPWVNVQRKLRRLVAATPLRLRCDCAAGPLRGRCDCAAMSLEFPNFAKRHNFKGTSGSMMGSYSDADSDIREEKSMREKTEQQRGGVCSPSADTNPGVSAHPKLNREPHYPNTTEPPGFEVPVRDPAGKQHTQSPVERPRRGRPKQAEPSPESEAAFDLLLWAIDQSMPGASIPDAGSARWRRWCQELDRLHRLGERGGGEGFPWEEIRRVIHWLPTHQGSGDFRWGMVIRSAPKLRQHFARLLAECKAGRKVATSTASGWRAVGKEVHQSIMETGDG